MVTTRSNHLDHNQRGTMPVRDEGQVKSNKVDSVLPRSKQPEPAQGDGSCGYCAFPRSLTFSQHTRLSSKRMLYVVSSKTLSSTITVRARGNRSKWKKTPQPRIHQCVDLTRQSPRYSTLTPTPSLKFVPTVPVVAMEKEGRTLIGPWGYLNRKLPFVELP